MFPLVHRHEQEEGSASNQVALDKDLWVAPLKDRNTRPIQMKKFPNFFTASPPSQKVVSVTKMQIAK